MALGPVYIPLCPPQIGRLNLQKTAFKNICNFFEGDCIICSSNHSPHSIQFRPIRDEAGNREKNMPRKWDKGNVAFLWMCFLPVSSCIYVCKQTRWQKQNRTKQNRDKPNRKKEEWKLRDWDNGNVVAEIDCFLYSFCCVCLFAIENRMKQKSQTKNKTKVKGGEKYSKNSL